jgi:hypothetical protein
MSNEAAAMPKWQILAFGIYLVALNLVLLYVLLKIWPTAIPLDPNRQLVAFTWSFPMPPERTYLLIALVSGALGSYIHLTTSFSDYVGNRQLVASWLWSYLLRPFIGMALAVIMYFVVRGGLILPSTSAESLSPYGVAAIGALAGMFSKQATDKLREVFENLFRTEEATKRKDALKDDAGQRSPRKRD